mmetsp:Transcript_7810/g.9474  ORF Transcript_7810/g.9474 Transcript_7810/m.9474 type:complete len:210 (+) Transcript_7810:123-752(+)|eukprot:jgi/Bigna1/64618/fgenesh1_kg.80_\
MEGSWERRNHPPCRRGDFCVHGSERRYRLHAARIAKRKICLERLRTSETLNRRFQSLLRARIRAYEAGRFCEDPKRRRSSDLKEILPRVVLPCVTQKFNTRETEGQSSRKSSYLLRRAVRHSPRNPNPSKPIRKYSSRAPMFLSYLAIWNKDKKSFRNRILHRRLKIAAFKSRGKSLLQNIVFHVTSSQHKIRRLSRSSLCAGRLRSHK